MNVKLSPRLSAVASLVKGGGILADIGTDHAYLPIFLVEAGVIPAAVAADIGKLPLQNAEKSVEVYGMSDKISLRLSDGLRGFTENDAEEFVFAGMGGTLIAEKLSETPWVKNSRFHFVFQPQSRAEDLREFLYSEGFEIGREIATHEGNRFYIAFDAVYTGCKKNFTQADCFLGKLPCSEDAKKHINGQLKRLEEKYAGLLRQGESDETEQLRKTIVTIKAFLSD